VGKKSESLLRIILFSMTVVTFTIPRAKIAMADDCNIIFRGEINSSTLTALKKRYDSLNGGRPKECASVGLFLNSPGGDMDAAMKAGDFVRQKKMVTTVAGTCASSCVLLFLGGVTRIAMAPDIGLHRPFSNSFSTSEEQAEATYEKINSSILKYLNRMNIPDTILRVMNSISPNGILWLTDEQLKEMDIVGEDPVYADQRDSGIAKRMGITKKELYSREQRGRAICGSPPEIKSGDDYPTLLNKSKSLTRYFKCREDVLHGRR
jgi:Clp protease